MLASEALKDLLSDRSVSQRDKLLLCLAVDNGAKAVKDIRALAVNNGFRKAKNVNISAVLRGSDGLAILVDAGWELSSKGIKLVQTLAGPLLNSPVPKVASSLRTHLATIKDKQTKTFVEEAILCFEMHQYRAAVVLSWVGAVAVLYDYVVKHELTAFNNDAVARFAKSRHPFQAARNADELSRLGESDFLIVLEQIAVLGKNVRQQLDGCLKLRNSCGHPNSYKLGEHKVSAHIEDLILNVFSVF